MLASRMEHLLWGKPEKGFQQTPPKAQMGSISRPGYSTDLWCLGHKTPTETVRISIGFQTKISLPFIIMYHTSKHLLVPRHFVGLWGSQ